MEAVDTLFTCNRFHSQHDERRRVLEEIRREFLEIVFAEIPVDVNGAAISRRRNCVCHLPCPIKD